MQNEPSPLTKELTKHYYHKNYHKKPIETDCLMDIETNTNFLASK